MWGHGLQESLHILISGVKMGALHCSHVPNKAVKKGVLSPCVHHQPQSYCLAQLKGLFTHRLSILSLLGEQISPFFCKGSLQARVKPFCKGWVRAKPPYFVQGHDGFEKPWGKRVGAKEAGRERDSR